jgi:hypothetical protein
MAFKCRTLKVKVQRGSTVMVVFIITSAEVMGG